MHGWILFVAMMMTAGILVAHEADTKINELKMEKRILIQALVEHNATIPAGVRVEAVR